MGLLTQVDPAYGAGSESVFWRPLLLPEAHESFGHDARSDVALHALLVDLLHFRWEVLPPQHAELRAGRQLSAAFFIEGGVVLVNSRVAAVVALLHRVRGAVPDHLLQVHTGQPRESEGFAVMGSDVGLALQASEVVGEVEQLFVAPVRVEGQDRDAVLDLKGETQHAVVDKNHVLQVAVSNDPQVLDEAELGLDAVLPVKPEVDQLATRVEVVEDRVGVLLVGGCEGYHLVELIGLPQALKEVGPHVDASVCVVTIVVEGDSEHDVRLLAVWVPLVEAVDHGLVDVEEQDFLVGGVLRRRQVDALFLGVVLEVGVQQGDGLESIESLNQMLLMYLCARLTLLIQRHVSLRDLIVRHCVHILNLYMRLS